MSFAIAVARFYDDLADRLGAGAPAAFAVLTVDTMEQALARSGGGKRDSGRHAAEAVLALARVREKLG